MQTRHTAGFVISLGILDEKNVEETEYLKKINIEETEYLVFNNIEEAVYE